MPKLFKTSNGLPPAQGMYDPRYEHDACGMGFVANIEGEKSHDIILQGIEVLHQPDAPRRLRLRSGDGRRRWRSDSDSA